jgi:hypothetical protein
MSTCGCSQINVPQKISRMTVNVPVNQRMSRMRSVMIASSEEYIVTALAHRAFMCG